MKTKEFCLKKKAIALLLSGLAIPCVTLAAEKIDLAEQDIANVEITSSKIAKPVDTTPAMITVITAKDLFDRNAKDLRTALSLVAGVDIAPGGDGGPASAAPGMWGLREFDAFLLVVDGVPWGGVFNPAVTTLSMSNIDRIEVQRGSAPVMYGATSFVGVIHVIHAAAGNVNSEASIGIGSHQSVNVGVATNLPTVAGFKQSVYFDASKQAFSQQDAKLNRAHMLYRAAADLDDAAWRSISAFTCPRHRAACSDWDAGHGRLQLLLLSGDSADKRGHSNYRAIYGAGLGAALHGGTWAAKAHVEAYWCRGVGRRGYRAGHRLDSRQRVSAGSYWSGSRVAGGALVQLLQYRGARSSRAL